MPDDWNQRKIPKFQNLKKPQVFAKYGVPGFLSKKTFEQTYEQYVKHLADQLNEMTAGTVYTLPSGRLPRSTATDLLT